MGFKKKSGFRDKVSKKSTLASKIGQFKQEQEAQPNNDENPLLKLSKITKKERQQTKSINFTDRVASNSILNLSRGVSKSTLKRRRKAAREQLKPKLDDLLNSLPTSTVNIVETSSKNGFIKDQSRKSLGQPNPQKHSGHTKLLHSEHERFSKVLQDESFQKSPFAALREAIAQNKQ